MNFDLMPRGPFNLANTNQYFGGWLTLGSDQKAIVMTFPVEGWQASAAVVMHQDSSGTVHGEVYCGDAHAEAAWKQALAALSLDYDGSGWSAAGERGPPLGQLQREHKYLCPVLFHSPYESAVAFVIGHRISVKQGRAIRQRMAQQHGDKIKVGNEVFHAFPRPQVLKTLTDIVGVSSAKIPRLHAIADAALEGWLNRATLRAMSEDEALEKLRSLPGIGAFFSQGILYRGAGLADAVTDDEMTKKAFQRAFSLSKPPDYETMLRLAELWRPYRMWATVLLHVSLRREGERQRTRKTLLRKR